MARVLIVGCGARGMALGRDLLADGHAVRGTTRGPARVGELEEAGIEPWVGDPDRVGSLVYAMDSVTILCWLLGSARGSRDALAALHGPRLAMMFEKTVDTTVRGVLCEAVGSVDPDVLAGGVRTARHAEETWEIPVGLLEAQPQPCDAWVRAARAGVDRLLAPRERLVA